MPESKFSPIETAHFRFALIAPIIQGTYSDPSASAYYRRVTEKPLTLPDGRVFHYQPGTLKKWVKYYKKGGMDALMPKTRSDKGATRTLTDTAIEEDLSPEAEVSQIKCYADSCTPHSGRFPSVSGFCCIRTALCQT